MKLHTVWEMTEDESLTLLDAWDDDSVAMSGGEWSDALATARHGREGEVRVIAVEVNDEDIRRAFRSPTVPGQVAHSGETQEGE